MAFEGQEISPGFLAGSLIIDSIEDSEGDTALTITDGTTSEIGSTTFTSATGSFTEDMVGSKIYLSGGTNLTSGFYEITEYINTNIVTLDSAPDDGEGGVSDVKCVVKDTTYNIRVLAVTTERLETTSSNENYNIQAACSLDAVFCPYTTDPDSETDFPRFEEPDEDASTPTVNNLNPFGDGGISCVLTDSTTAGTETVFDEYDGGVKGVGLKSPIIVTGWGYDTNDKPIPVDPDNENAFLDNYKNRADQWKSGPLDIRWDDSRKVWNASGGGSSSKIGKLSTALYYESSAEVDIWQHDDDLSLTITDGTTDEAGSTTFTSVTGGFIEDMVGSVINLSDEGAAVNLVPGSYIIEEYVDENTVVLDNSPDNGVGGVSGVSGDVETFSADGTSETAFDWLLQTNTFLPVGTKVIIVKIGNYWYVESAQPPCD